MSALSKPNGLSKVYCLNVMSQVTLFAPMTAEFRSGKQTTITPGDWPRKGVSSLRRAHRASSAHAPNSSPPGTLNLLSK